VAQSRPRRLGVKPQGLLFTMGGVLGSFLGFSFSFFPLLASVTATTQRRPFL
jgi:hypothetical protein